MGSPNRVHQLQIAACKDKGKTYENKYISLERSNADEKSKNRQEVDSAGTCATSKLSGHTGTWTRTGYEAEGADAARTYVVTVSGKLTIAGAVFNNKLAKVEFYCSATGVVS